MFIPVKNQCLCKSISADLRRLQACEVSTQHFHDNNSCVSWGKILCSVKIMALFLCPGRKKWQCFRLFDLNSLLWCESGSICCHSSVSFGDMFHCHLLFALLWWSVLFVISRCGSGWHRPSFTSVKATTKCYRMINSFQKYPSHLVIKHREHIQEQFHTWMWIRLQFFTSTCQLVSCWCCTCRQ